MNRRNEASDFEHWLDRELPGAVAGGLGPAKPPPPLVARPLRRGVARLGVPGAAVVLGVALAVAGGGAALATGSPNPVSWGRHVVQAVSVSSAAPQRGPAPAPESAPPEARPSAPAGDGQQGAGAQGDQRSNGNAGSGKQQGRGDGGALSDQNQNTNRPAKLRGDRQGASQQP
jgi:hypothetical protein